MQWELTHAIHFWQVPDTSETTPAVMWHCSAKCISHQVFTQGRQAQSSASHPPWWETPTGLCVVPFTPVITGERISSTLSGSILMKMNVDGDKTISLHNQMVLALTTRVGMGWGGVGEGSVTWLSVSLFLDLVKFLHNFNVWWTVRWEPQIESSSSPKGGF